MNVLTMTRNAGEITITSRDLKIRSSVHGVCNRERSESESIGEVCSQQTSGAFINVLKVAKQCVHFLAAACTALSLGTGAIANYAFNER